ncbi:hypothetical protein E2986_10796 [Frieseomelitta varia]|uniref:Uncharacterized protein n=1 Tax=Frieseomelitta varia TaxID=561572 RepID=A0A833RXV1_9HYME|nr:hypothetical protein E2986_10796 [Frieseomelitta varia]
MELSKSDIGRFDRRCSNRLACEQIGIRAPVNGLANGAMLAG